MTNSGPYEFPRFKRITVNDKDLIEKVTVSYPPYSDFNVLSLLCWNPNDDNSFSVLDRNLIIRLKDYLQDDYVYSVFGVNRLNGTFKRLFEMKVRIKLVPEFVAEKLDSSKYLIEEDRDGFDYVIGTKDLSVMEGTGYKTLRRYIKTFKDEYKNNDVDELDLSDVSVRGQVIQLVEEWSELKGMSVKEKEEDIKAIRTLVDNYSNFNILALGLFVNKKLIAFTLNEMLNKSWVIGHFGKALNSYRKCSFYLEVAGADWFNKRGYRFLNLQQDTGILGLREAKMVFKPAYFLRKYTVKPA